jgi:NAD(P)-dependent dehydrogenase (short-subunit alcohol dehydrogenase family)
MHPVGRLGDPRDVGNLAVWLASDQSGFVTGQVFVVDGGRTKKLPLPVS